MKLYHSNSSGHYSAAVEYKGVLYISGQLSVDPNTGKPVKGGLKAEAKQALKNLSSVLHQAKLTNKDIIMCRIYLPDVKYWGDFNEVYTSYFGEHKPARVVVPSNNLYADCLVEIEAIAAFN